MFNSGLSVFLIIKELLLLFIPAAVFFRCCSNLEWSNTAANARKVTRRLREVPLSRMSTTIANISLGIGIRVSNL